MVGGGEQEKCVTRKGKFPKKHQHYIVWAWLQFNSFSLTSMTLLYESYSCCISHFHNYISGVIP